MTVRACRMRSPDKPKFRGFAPFPLPPGITIATAIALCPLVMWRRWMLAGPTAAAILCCASRARARVLFQEFRLVFCAALSEHQGGGGFRGGLLCEAGTQFIVQQPQHDLPAMALRARARVRTGRETRPFVVKRYGFVSSYVQFSGPSPSHHCPVNSCSQVVCTGDDIRRRRMAAICRWLGDMVNSRLTV